MKGADFFMNMTTKHPRVRLKFLWVGLAVSAWAGTVLGASWPEVYTDKIASTPDLYQMDPRAGLVNGGRSCCGAVTMANSMFTLEAMGFTGLTPEGGREFERVSELALLLSGDDYTASASQRGTSVHRMFRAAKGWVEEKGYEPVFDYQGWRPAPGFAGAPTHPTLDWIKEQVAGDRVVWLNLGWYQHNQETDTYVRTGGHWVTVVGYGLDKSSRKDPHFLIIHDSATDGREKSDYVRVEVIPSGQLGGPMWVRGTPGFAAGQLKLTENMRINPKGDTGIIDSVVVMGLARR